MTQTFESFVAESNLLAQAQQGDAEAIATLLNRALNPKGIAAQARIDQGRLHLLLDGNPVPSQQSLVPFLQQGLSSLGIQAFQAVSVYGRQLGQRQVAWQQAIALTSSATAFTAPPGASGLPVTSVEMEHESSTDPVVAIGSKSLYLTPQGGLVQLTPYRKPPLLRTQPPPTAAQFCQPVADRVGRVAEMDAAVDALKASQPVEIYGDRGVGKTTLLRSLAHHPEVAPVYPDGILYRQVRRQPPDDLLHALFEDFFELDGELPHKPTREQIYHDLRGKRALLVLDDVDWPASTVQRLLRQLPSVNVLLAAGEQRLGPDSFAIPLSGLPLADAMTLIEQGLDTPLNANDRSSAEALCHALAGNPLRLKQAIALLQNRQLALPTLVQQLQATTAPEVLTLRGCATLPEPERRALAALGVLGDTPVRTHHLAGLMGVSNPQPVLDQLVQQGLLVTDGFRYALAGNLAPVLRRVWNLSQWVQPVIRHFMAWARQYVSTTGALVSEAEVLRQVLELASQTRQWAEVLELAQLTDSALAVDGYWSLWEEFWQRGLHAAQELGNQGAIALALHQLGTRALCLDDSFTAHSDLTQALHLREAVGEVAGATVTRHNLEVLTNPTLPEAPYEPEAATPQAVAQSAPTPDDRRENSVSALIAVGFVSALAAGGYLAVQMSQENANFALTPSRLDFTEQAVHTASPSRAVTLQNNGAEPLDLGRIATTGDHATDFQIVQETCSQTPVPARQPCTIQVAFNPQAEGERQANLIVSDRTGSIQQSIPLTGISPSAPVTSVVLSFQPGSLNFGDQPVEQPSDTRRIVLRNDSANPVTIQTIGPEGDAQSEFGVTHDCTGAPLVAGQSCSIWVVFQPRQEGGRAATLAVTDTSNGRWTVPLQGNGVVRVPSAPVLSLSPGSVDFREQAVGTVSAEQIAYVTNFGNQPLIINQVVQEGSNEFSIRRNTCLRGPISPNSNCQIGVVYTPQRSGQSSARLRLPSNDPRGTAELFLSGRAVEPVRPSMSVVPPRLDFGAVELESASRPQSITIANNGSGVLSIGEIRANGNVDFASDRNVPMGRECANINLQPRESCAFGVVFIPQVEGDRRAQIAIFSNAPERTVNVALSGYGIVRRFASLSVTPSSLDFGSQQVGITSNPQSLTLINNGTAPLQIGDITMGGAHPYDFSTSNSSNFGVECSNISLEPGQRCTLQVYFGPIDQNARSAQLVIPSNDPGSPAVVMLRGSAYSPEPMPTVDPGVRPQPLPGIPPTIQPR